MEISAALLKVIDQAKKQFHSFTVLKEQLIHLPLNKPIYIFALGKAAYQMTDAVIKYARQEQFIRIVGGLVISLYGNIRGPLPHLTTIESNHPIPDENSFYAGEAAIKFLENLRPDDTLLVLLSGGGSSLMEKPAPGVTREEIIEKTKELLLSGANIEEVNTVRKKLSAVKGGKLLGHVKCKSIFVFVMSDVPGDKPKYIASNPFIPAAEASEDQIGLDSFRRYDGFSGNKHITPGKAIVYKMIANNHTFCDAVKIGALEFLPKLQYDRIYIIATDLSGESSQRGKEIAGLAKLIYMQRNKGFAAFRTPCLLVFGGETSVSVKGEGEGGRCTELALAAVEGLAEVPNCHLLAYATDGRDGLCDAAGAVVNSHTRQALVDEGIDIEAYLDKNDSYTALKTIDAIIPSEYTGINVNDVVLLYIE